MAQVFDQPDPEPERTRPRLSRMRLRPTWLREGQWVLLRRNIRFGRVQGEHHHSTRTAFEIVVGEDGTRYLIPIDEAARALRPIAETRTAEEMLRVLKSNTVAFHPSLSVARGMLCDGTWAHAMPATLAALLATCYRDPALRQGKTAAPFVQLEGLVLKEIELVLDYDRTDLRNELHQHHGLD